jgi:hypothetical protein
VLYTPTWSPLTHIYITPIVKGGNPLLRGDLCFCGFTWPQITDILFIQNYLSYEIYKFFLCGQILFHPSSGDVEAGEIGAVRLGSYKVVYYTGKF